MKSLEGLNEEQKEAVLHSEGPLLIVAGAGAGKTKTITHRIARLIESGIPGDKILAVTFTNKAAKELKDRVTSLIEKKGGVPTVATFHGFSVLLLREFYDYVGGKKDFKILDESDAEKLIKEAVIKQNLDPKKYEPRKIKKIISSKTNGGITPLEYKDSSRGGFEDIISDVWEKYENLKKRENGLDFDDLLIKALDVLKNPSVEEILKKRYLYIHIDEYQDTNIIQYEMVKILGKESGNICVVGDVDQNIYSWRGAHIRHLLSFEKDFPGAKTVFLEKNYRSTETILAAADEIIKHNKMRVPKNLHATRESGEKIVFSLSYDEVGESCFVAREIVSIIDSGVAPHDIAVLYRTNSQSRPIEEAMLEHSIPYQVLGTKFFERKEVKDVLAYLRLALNGFTPLSLERVINFPPRGIGKASEEKIIKGNLEELTPKARASYSNFVGKIGLIRNTLIEEGLIPALKTIIEKTGLTEYFLESNEEEKVGNMQELVNFASRYEGTPGEEAGQSLLADAALFGEQDNMKEEKSEVRLMTIHASKGLEFSHVFIVGLEEGLFPMERDANEDEEEERRLMYVALTRAKNKLYLSAAETRLRYGTREQKILSRFIKDIPEELLENGDDGESIRTIYI